MGTAGKVAFPVILFLGAVTGYLTYTNFTAATPDPGVIESPYWKPIPADEVGGGGGDTAGGGEGEETGGGEEQIDESQFEKIVTIDILEGAATQGNPDYRPEPATASAGSLIKWVNKDSAPHSATSGKSPSDADYGKLFDTGLLQQDEEYSIPADKIGKGEHPYFCLVHPYMTSTITIE